VDSRASNISVHVPGLARNGAKPLQSGEEIINVQ
jgi:hypothetical protein